MYKHISKDNKLRFKFLISENFRVIFSFLAYNRLFNLNKYYRNRILFVKFFHEFFKQNSKVKIHNFCFYSGRARGIYRQFHLSRLCLREFASKGAINGLKKASW